MGVGIVEDLFQAQIWTNDQVNEEKKAMRLAGKVVLQTNDNTITSNILTDVDNGQIIKWKKAPITPIQLTAAALPQYQEVINRWESQADKVTSSFNSVTGETLPSGTPYRLGALLNQEGHSYFDYRREEAGLFIEEIYRDWVIPFLKKQLSDEHELTTLFDASELETIDEAFINYEVNEEAKKRMLSGKIVDQAQLDELKATIKTSLKKHGNRRTINIPEGYFDNLEAKISVVTTNEERVKSVYLESLSNILTTVASNPNVLTDPKLSKIFNEILEQVGFSPELLADIQTTPSNPQIPQANPAAQNPQQQSVLGQPAQPQNITS